MNRFDYIRGQISTKLNDCHTAEKKNIVSAQWRNKQGYKFDAIKSWYVWRWKKRRFDVNFRGTLFLYYPNDFAHICAINRSKVCQVTYIRHLVALRIYSPTSTIFKSRVSHFESTICVKFRYLNRCLNYILQCERNR